jgi:serine/threonine protein kinase/tetratricopeptide (TPR) repeat protein
MSSDARSGSRNYSRADFSNLPDGDFSSALGQLSREQRERLTEILDRYLSALENDAPLSQQALLEENADIAPALANYFRSLEDLHDMAAGFGGGPSPAILEDEPKGQRRIGDFELLREIGRGGMGVVYEARQISLDRRVAVKLLPFAAVLDSKQIARFKHEAQAAAQLHHPNIVPVFAIGVDRGVHYYAMQYIDGQPLDRAIEEMRGSGKRSEVRGQRSDGLAVTKLWRPGSGSKGSAKGHRPHPLPEEEGTVNRYASETRDERRAKTRQASRLVVGSIASSEHYRTVARLGMQAAEALNAAHEYGVVHRDVKPSNLLVEADGKLWITDFGLARFGRDGGLTRSGDLIGTIRYMSPEQAAGSAALVDHRTDIYSLGVTLYELATLRPAFAEENEAALLKQIGTYIPPRPRSLRSDVPADLETVILKAMSPEKETRYATAADLAADLKCILEEKPTKARPPTLLDRAGRWARRRQRLVLGLLIALCTALIGLSTAAGLVTRLNWKAKESTERAERSLRAQGEMLNGLAMDFATELEKLPGAEEVRQNLLLGTARNYRKFIDDAAGDAARQSAAAAAYSTVGSMLSDVGQAKKGVEIQREAEDILRQLAATEPENWQIQKQLAEVESRHGISLFKAGNAKEAEERLQQVIRRQERLLARQPKDESLAAGLAQSLSNLGLVQQNLNQAAQATASFEDAAARLEKLVAAKPDDSRLKQQLAMVFNNWAALHATNRPAEAAKLHAKAIELLRKLAVGDSMDMSVEHDLALSLNNLGSALARSGQAEKARNAYREAIALRQSLVSIAPARVSYRSDLAMTWNNLGMLAYRQGDHEAAKTAFNESIDLYESLAEQLAGEAGTQSNLASVYNNLAIDQEKAGELEAAASSLALAIQHQEAAAAASPEVAKYQDLLAKHIESRLRVVKKLGGGGESLPGPEKLPNRYEPEGRFDYIDRG